MIKIMFVCYGNICRSPMAEFVFKSIVEKNGASDEFFISSSATSDEEVGNSVYRNARDELSRHGISCAGKHSVQLKHSDGEAYDLFIGMDNDNIACMRRILDEKNEHKIHRLMDYTPHGGQVADPWYTRDFKKAYDDILLGCTCLFEELTRHEVKK